jgi:hypothetical protein
MKSTYRLRAVLGLKLHNYPHLLERSKAICNGISSHPTLFADPSPSVVDLKLLIEAFDQSQQAAATRAKGTVAARNQKAEEVISLLEVARVYIQGLVDASPEQGMILIEAAAMLVRKPREYTKPLLQATQGKPSSPVLLRANVGALTAGLSGKVTFHWQMSDNNGATWSNLPSTPLGSVEVENLTPLATYAFRVCVSAGKAPSTAWSQAVILMVH